MAALQHSASFSENADFLAPPASGILGVDNRERLHAHWTLEREGRFVSHKRALEDQQHPEPHGVIANVQGMFTQQALYRIRSNQSSPLQPRRTERVFEVAFQLAAQPSLQWHHESLLGAMHDIEGEMTLRESLQEKLASSTAHLIVGLQSCAPSEKIMIQVRHPRFEGMRHGRAIDLGQQVIG
jgi:hypothetical protein